MGAVTQFRMMGGAVILAIATSVFKIHVMPQLRDLGIGSLEDLAKLEQLQTGIGPLSESFQEDVRSILSQGFIDALYFRSSRAPSPVVGLEAATNPSS